MQKIWYVMSILLCVYIYSLAEEESQDSDLSKIAEAAENSGAVMMDVIQVQGKIDRPQAVYIINLANPGFRNVALEKDFSNEIKNEKFEDIGHFSVDDILEPEMDKLDPVYNK